MKKRIGKGTVQLMTAQVVFLASGYAIHFGLGRLLGPELYGIFGVVISLLTLSAIISRVGIPRAASKFIAEDVELVNTIKKKALGIILVLGIIVSSLYFIFAGVIANLLNDPTLVPYLRLSAFAILPAALYTIYLASLNGMRLFGKQATASVIYSLTKVSLVLGLVMMGYSVAGAILGYVAASLVGMLVARYQCNFKGVVNDFDVRKLIGFAIPVMFFSVATNLLMSIDLLSIKAILKENVLTGYYTAASTLAKPPFFIFAAVSGTLFPSIANAYAKNDKKLTSRYITQSLRYLLLLLVPLTFMVSATSENLISLVYTSTYVPAGPALGILIFGIGFMTLTTVLNAVIMGIGKPWISLTIALVIIPIAVVLNLILIPLYQLNGAAIATTVTAFIGTLISASYVFRKFKPLVSPLSFVRILIVSLFIYLISSSYPLAGILLPLEYAFLFLIYFATLRIVGELKNEDIETVKGIFLR